MHTYFAIYKPFNVLSQFSSPDGRRTLKDFFDVPGNVYPVGRLDYDSEGLLLLTNDSGLNHRLLDPGFGHEREYYVQVEGSIDQPAIQRLQSGVDISLNGKTYRTRPCKARLFTVPPAVPDRDPPIRYRANIPTSWIKLILTEGKNRQVRKMTAGTGFPTLRLIRYRIGLLDLAGLQPGEMRKLGKEEVYRLLEIGR
ncbi:MAG: pseudouridine synthase [Puia sp.]|nr:pseudouridine synthase [Puia sp.]